MAKPHHIHIDHHHDGSHTSHRRHKKADGSEETRSSAHHDLDGVHDMLQDHLGTSNPGEAEADAGQHGVPAEHAEPAGLTGAPPATTPVMPGQGV